MNTEHARDLTQAERQDLFGTTDNKDLELLCKVHDIRYCYTSNGFNLVIWRCHLPRKLERKLQLFEAMGRVYVGGFDWSGLRIAS